MEIHQALTRSSLIRNILPKHEQSGIFAAEGYARVWPPSVCIATSGPGATKFATGLGDAMLTACLSSGRPGPILIDIPKYVQQQVVVPNWRWESNRLRWYVSRLPKPPEDSITGDYKLLEEEKHSNRLRNDGLFGSFGDLEVVREELKEKKKNYPLSLKTFEDAIPPQYAIRVLDGLTNGKAVISTGVEQLQM
ncbi:Thiamine pyrophosphate enzyme [Macleaya cordata]|uniref:Thiamine pyrophosphate enzyme n=1 Tax=Macleaya cordata TaxID=56857 RepID=A0A200QJM7_MACCD|nr:Thiamine pyrophosphate enzyme [Macleaya cordata]